MEIGGQTRFSSFCRGRRRDRTMKIESDPNFPYPNRGPSMANVIPDVATDVLQAFADAWNRHDVDALMSFMTDDCVFESSAGPDACGTRYVGRDAVRAGFAEVWTVFPDAHWGNARHFVHGIAESRSGPSR